MNERKISIGLIAIGSFILFYKIFFEEFAYSDSFDFLANADHPYFLNRWIQSGRILFGLMAKWIFTNLSISQLFWVRLFALTGTMLFLFSLYKYLLRFYDSIIALLIAMLVLFTPSMTIITLWTSTFQVSWALYLSFQAALIFQRGIETKFDWMKVSAGFVLAFVALNLYQPGFTAFIIPAFVEVLNKPKKAINITKLVGIHLVVYLLYFVWFKLSLSWFEINPEPRSGLNTGFFRSLIWVFKHPFKQSAQLSLILAPGWVLKSLPILMGTVILANVFLTYLSWINRLLFLLQILAFFCLSVLPNFLVVDHLISYRMLSVLSVLLIISMGNLASLPFTFIKLRKGFLYGTSLIVMIAGYYNANELFIGIQVNEYAMADQFIANLDSENTNTVLVKVPRPRFLAETGRIRRTITDEFGELSNAIPWVPKPYFDLLLEKHGLDSIKVKIIPRDMAVNPNKNEVLFDIEKEWLLRYP